ncbi:MAG: antibiotic biosynthesis monooxygenase family protein [Polyangiaceae bacterium]
MFVRLGSFEIKPGALEALRSTYNEACVPLVRAAEGNVDCFLLEPVDGASAIIACTMWKTEADATRYESSGTAQEIVAKVREHFAGPPKLGSYRVRRPGSAA